MKEAFPNGSEREEKVQKIINILSIDNDYPCADGGVGRAEYVHGQAERLADLNAEPKVIVRVLNPETIDRIQQEYSRLRDTKRKKLEKLGIALQVPLRRPDTMSYKGKEIWGAENFFRTADYKKIGATVPVAGDYARHLVEKFEREFQQLPVPVKKELTAYYRSIYHPNFINDYLLALRNLGLIEEGGYQKLLDADRAHKKIVMPVRRFGPAGYEEAYFSNGNNNYMMTKGASPQEPGRVYFWATVEL